MANLKTPEEKLVEYVGIYLTSKQKEEIKLRAKKEGLDMSSYIRRELFLLHKDDED